MNESLFCYEGPKNILSDGRQKYRFFMVSGAWGVAANVKLPSAHMLFVSFFYTGEHIKTVSLWNFSANNVNRNKTPPFDEFIS